MSTEDPKPKRKREDELDEALDESFPASDPPSTSVPGSGRDGQDEEEKDDRTGKTSGTRPADPGRLRRGSGGMPIRDE